MIANETAARRRVRAAARGWFFAWLVLWAGLALGSFPAFAQAPAPPAKPQEPAYDPYRAAKDIEIGNFYLKKGDVDAAIDRFLDALRYKPDFAEPCRLLGEAYEKKDEKAEALKYYREYLRIRPKAPDAGKIRKRISKLSHEVGQK